MQTQTVANSFTNTNLNGILSLLTNKINKMLENDKGIMKLNKHLAFATYLNLSVKAENTKYLYNLYRF